MDPRAGGGSENPWKIQKAKLPTRDELKGPFKGMRAKKKKSAVTRESEHWVAEGEGGEEGGTTTPPTSPPQTTSPPQQPPQTTSPPQQPPQTSSPPQKKSQPAAGRRSDGADLLAKRQVQRSTELGEHPGQMTGTTTAQEDLATGHREQKAKSQTPVDPSKPRGAKQSPVSPSYSKKDWDALGGGLATPIRIGRSGSTAQGRAQAQQAVSSLTQVNGGRGVMWFNGNDPRRELVTPTPGQGMVSAVQQQGGGSPAPRPATQWPTHGTIQPNTGSGTIGHSGNEIDEVSGPVNPAGHDPDVDPQKAAAARRNFFPKTQSVNQGKPNEQKFRAL